VTDTEDAVAPPLVSALVDTAIVAVAGTFVKVQALLTTAQVCECPLIDTLTVDTVCIDVAPTAFPVPSGFTLMTTVPEVERETANVTSGVAGVEEDEFPCEITGVATSGALNVVKERTLPDWFTETEFEAKTT
jgi:hypothetical protein